MVSFKSTAILTVSGSVEPLSRSNLASLNFHVVKDSLKEFGEVADATCSQCPMTCWCCLRWWCL